MAKLLWLKMKSAGTRLEPEDYPAWGQCGWTGSLRLSLGSFCHKHKINSWSFLSWAPNYHGQFICNIDSLCHKQHNTWPGPLQAPAQCWTQLSCFHRQLWLIAMFAQGRARANKPQRPMLALCHSMGWDLSSCFPQICWKKLYADRPISISADIQLLSCQAGTGLKLKH